MSTTTKIAGNFKRTSFKIQASIALCSLDCSRFFDVQTIMKVLVAWLVVLTYSMQKD